MNIYCDSINDIYILSAILANSYLLNIKLISNSTIEILFDRKCKENLDNNHQFHQLCKLTINNVNLSSIENMSGIIKQLSYENENNNIILKFHLHVYQNNQYVFHYIYIPIYSMSVYIINLDTQRITQY